MKVAGTFHQAGVYDSEILFEECEKKFSEFDRYGWEILGPMAVDGPPPGLNLGNDVFKIDRDTDKLRRFILSVLWRASVSKNPFYLRKSGSVRKYNKSEVIRSFDPRPLSKYEFQTVAMILQDPEPRKRVQVGLNKGARQETRWLAQSSSIAKASFATELSKTNVIALAD